MVLKCMEFKQRRKLKILSCLLFILMAICFWLIRISASKNQAEDLKVAGQKNSSRLTEKRRITQYPVIKLPIGTDCEQRKRGNFSLSKQNLPLTALASVFRSGNTWLRHLLQMATGIGTSSVYCDRELRAKGFPYECSHDRFRQVLVVKTHETERRPQNKNVEEDIPVPEYDRAVLLIRDPYNFIVANRHGSHLGVAREDGFFTEAWRRQQPKLLQWWNDFNQYWLTFNGLDVYPMLYTNLLKDTETELRKLLNFLRMDYADDDIRCAMDYKEGYFHRKHFVWTRIHDITELFKPSMKTKIDSAVMLLSSHLEKKYGLKWVNESHSVERQNENV